MSEALMIVTPLVTGVSFAIPKEYSVVLAALGAGSGILGLLLAREGQIEAALIADMASIIFGVISMLKALEAM